jgi:hypothetical protein
LLCRWLPNMIVPVMGFSRFMGKQIPDECHAAVRGTSHESNRFVIRRVPVAAVIAFDVFDAGGGAGDDEDLDLVPPPADCAEELVCFRPSCRLHQGLSSSFASAASASEFVRSRIRSGSLTFHTAFNFPVAPSPVK